MNTKNNSLKLIYVLHEYGYPDHYAGLDYYCKQHNIRLKFREFNLITQFGVAVKNLNRVKFRKATVNLIFLIKLFFQKKQNIVLGIAPYDFNMIIFSWLARSHNIHYHTSWPYWDKVKYPKRKFIAIFDNAIFSAWKKFLEERCIGIFCVSEFTSAGITKNYKITCPITVVYHSIDEKVFFPKVNVTVGKPLRILFVGRLVENKGIRLILNLLDRFKKDTLSIGIAGGGELEPLVQEYEQKHPNLHFYGKIQRSDLGKIYRDYDVFLSPSMKGSGLGDWEELFGITLIEALACGLLTVASDHVGPSEILKDELGYLINDNRLKKEIITTIDSLIEMQPHVIKEKKNRGIKNVSKYFIPQIAVLWGSGLAINSK